MLKEDNAHQQNRARLNRVRRKICFVSMTNIMSTPYLVRYTELLKCNYDIIYWNRYGIEEKSAATVQYPLEYILPKGASKVQKLIGYIKFKSFATKVLRENNYEKVVLLSGNTAVLLKQILLSKYCGHYIIDIRDYFMERNKLYYYAEKKLIDNCGLAVISSPAYKCFLPKHDYLQVHNTPSITDEQMQMFHKKRSTYEAGRREGNPLVLSFIGGVRFFEQDKKVLSFFANDKRFLVRYIGAGADILREYCEQNNIRNAFMHDRFSPEQTLDFYADTDMILNLYGSGTPLLDYALSNKLYYAATLEIPILVCPHTYMEEIAVGNGFGVSVNLDDRHCRDDVFIWYNSLDRQQMHSNCERFLAGIRQDDSLFSHRVHGYLNCM